MTHGAAGAIALFLGVGIGISDDEARAEAPETGPVPKTTVTKEVEVPGPAVTVTTSATVTAKPPKPPKPKGPPTSVGGDGEYLVGEEMRAGTYRTAGPGDSFGCYWERARNSSGEFDAIIANGNLEGSGRVTVNKGESFKSTGCPDRKKAGRSPPPAPPAPPPVRPAPGPRGRPARSCRCRGGSRSSGP